MGKRKKTELETATPQPQAASTGKTEEKPIRYVVIREGYRVSDKEYETLTDPDCVAEVQFWTKVAKNHSYGEKVEAIQYDSKKHRIW